MKSMCCLPQLCRYGLSIVVFIAMIAEVGLLLAQPAPVVEGDPHNGSHTWRTPTPVVQSQQDPSIPPAATGAIFVPVITDVLAEPQYIVRRGDTVLARADMGTNTYVKPGAYEVLAGSGAIDSMLVFDVVVVEGRTTYVPVEWSAVVVATVDERGTPFRGNYELVRLPEREYVGIGLGADLAQGERLNTWILRPGTYMILGAGESYQARKNFFTLRVPPGELIEYTLVMDEETGDFLGAGEVVSTEDNVQTGFWNISLVLGGSVAFSQVANFTGKPEGMSLRLSGFAETIGSYDDGEHHLYGRLNIEEAGAVDLPDRPYILSVDEITLDLLYMYRLAPWFGPYARVAFESRLVPAIQPFDEPTTVRKLNADGELLSEKKDVNEVRLADSFSPITLKAGTGGRFDLSPAHWLNLSTRLGLGWRQVFRLGLFDIVDSNSNPATLSQGDDLSQLGIELALVGQISITRWVLWKVEFDLFEPFDRPKDPFLQLDSTVALRLASFASLNYTVLLRDDPALRDELQVDQAVLLRFAYKIF